MQIHVHVGVHKTATTFVQGVLRHNLPVLNEAGVGYVPLGKVRPWLTRRLMSYNPSEFCLEEHLEQFFPAGAPTNVVGLVISDENLLGDCQSFVRTGRLYERLEQRLGKLHQLLAGHDVSLFCAIRSYDSFPASAYCESMRHGGFSEFADFEQRIDWQTFCWPTLIKRMESSLSPSSIRVWRLEDFRSHADQIASELAFGAPMSVAVENPRSERQSFSQLAVDTLRVVADHMGKDVASTLARPVSNALPRSQERPAFMPWNGERVAELTARYAEHCKAIAADRWIVDPNLNEAAAASPARPVVAS